MQSTIARRQMQPVSSASTLKMEIPNMKLSNRTHVRPRASLVLGLLCVLFPNLPVDAQLVSIKDPRTNFNGIFRADVADFDPDRVNFLRATDSNVITLRDESVVIQNAEVLPGDEGVKAGSSAHAHATYSQLATENGILVLVIANSHSRAINADSDSYIATALSQFDFDVSPVGFSQNFFVTGETTTYFTNGGFQAAWNYPLLWEASSPVSVVSGGGDFLLSYSAPIPDRPDGPDDTSVSRGQFSSAIDVPVSNAYFLVHPMVETFIGEGVMPKQGNKEVEDWPMIQATVVSNTNFLLPTQGQTPGSSLKGSPSNTWGQPIFDYIDAINDALSSPYTMLLKNEADAISNGSAPQFSTLLESEGELLAASAASTFTNPSSPTLTLSTGVQSSASLFLSLPSDLYYEVPFADSALQKFVADGQETVLRINDFANLPGPIQVFAEGMDLGLFNEGDSLDFVSIFGHGIESFDLFNPQAASTTTPWSINLGFATESASMVVVVPEPSTLSLLTLSLGMLLVRRKRKRSP